MKYDTIIHIILYLEIDDVLGIVKNLESIKGFMNEPMTTYLKLSELYKILKNEAVNWE